MASWHCPAGMARNWSRSPPCGGRARLAAKPRAQASVRSAPSAARIEAREAGVVGMAGAADADLPLEARIGQILVARQPFRGAALAVVHHDAGALGDGEPHALRVAQPGGDPRLDHAGAEGRQHAGIGGPGQPGGIDGDEDIGRAVGALVADALDQLVGIALDQPDPDSGLLGEGLVQGPVRVIMPGGVEVHLPGRRGGAGAAGQQGGGGEAEQAARRTGGHAVSPG